MIDPTDQEFWKFVEEIRAVLNEHNVTDINDLPRPVAARIIRRGREMGYLVREDEEEAQAPE